MCVANPKNPSVTLNDGVTTQTLKTIEGCTTFSRKACGYIIISGTVSDVQELYVALVPAGYSGATNYASIKSAAERIDSPVAQLATVWIPAWTEDRLWATQFKNTAGTYRLFVYDAGTQKQLLESTIVSKE